MSLWSILLWPLGAFSAYLSICFIAGFIGGMAKAFAIQRRPKFRVIRFDDDSSA